MQEFHCCRQKHIIDGQIINKNGQEDQYENEITQEEPK